MIALTTASILVLFALTSGQLSPNPTPASVCTDPNVQSGGGYFADPVYCQGFTQCDAALNPNAKSCPPGTLYDTKTGVCVRPEQATCFNWPCDSARTGARYPDFCCDKYFECNGAGFVARNCSAGLVFNSQTGQCVTGTCLDKTYCYRPSTQNNAGYVCYDVPNPDGNPCAYTTIDRTRNITDRSCPAGTSFSRENCQCSNLNSNCPSGVQLTANKVLDANCRVSFNMELNSFPLVATSDKLGSANTLLPYTFQTVGVLVANGVAVLRPDPATGASPYIYNYFLNNNQLASPVVFSVVFKVDSGAPSGQFVLLTNNYNPNLCSPTLEVTVNYNNGLYQFTINAVGGTAVGSSETRISGSTQGSISVNPNNFVEVIITFNGAVSAQLVDRGTNGGSTGNNVNLPASNNLGAYLAANKCGFQWGRGLYGSIDRIRIYEGCGDLTRVRV